MSSRDPINDELRNLFTGDYLVCRACGEIVYQAPLTPRTFKFSEVARAVRNHWKKCAAFRRSQNKNPESRLCACSGSESYNKNPGTCKAATGS